MTSTSNPKKVREAERAEQLRIKQQAADLREIMDTPGGRRFLRRLIYEVAGRDRSSYRDAVRGSDPVFLEGNRNVGLLLLEEMRQVSTNLYLLMEAEHFEALQKQQREQLEETGDEDV